MDPYDGAEEADGRPIGRRTVLGLLGLGAAGILVGGKVQDFIERTLRPVTVRDPTGLSSFIPGTGRFRFYSVTGGFPKRTDAEYRLGVSGLVTTPATYTVADLRTKLPQTRLTKDFQCVTGWRVEDVAWQGVLLRDLLDLAGVKPTGTFVNFRSFDGVYTESLSMEQARRSDVIVAHEMLGKPVTSDHGGPVRLYVAPMYGYKSCKWLSGIEVVDALEPGYWEQLGYDVDGWVGRSNGRDDEPTS